MSIIEEMFSSYCPNGVEYKTLEELGLFYGGLSGKNKNDFVDGNSRYITYLNIYNNPVVDLSAVDLVHISSNEHQNQAHKGDVFFTGSSETKEECAIASVLADEPSFPLFLNSFCFGLKMNDPDLFNPYFLKHLLRSDKMRKQLIGTASGVTRYNVSKSKMAQIRIPVPPIEIQNKIANILDRYEDSNSKLLLELNTELETRKKQHSFYLSSVFAKEKNYKEMTIRDVCLKTSSGGTPKTSHSEYYGGTIPWLRTQEIDWSDIYDTEVKITEEGLHNSSAKLIPENCVIVAMYGATAAKSAINRIPLTTNQACCNLQINPNIATSEYVYQWLIKDYKKLKSLGRGSQDNLNADMIKSFPIRIPSIESQKKITKTISEIESAYTSLEKSIKNEIEQRNRQFSYYRDKLLTFPDSQ